MSRVSIWYKRRAAPACGEPETSCFVDKNSAQAFFAANDAKAVKKR